MFLYNIKAKFYVAHVSFNSLLTFFPFSDSQSPQGTKDNIDTSVPLLFILFAKLMIWSAISNGFWLLFCPIVKNNHVWFPCNGWSDIAFHILCCWTTILQPWNILLRDLFKLWLGTFWTIELPTIVSFFVLLFSVGVQSFFFIRMMKRTFNYLLFCFPFGNFITNSSGIIFHQFFYLKS